MSKDLDVLSLASNEMRLQMVLRNPTDVEKPKTQSTAVQYLFTGVDGMPGPQNRSRRRA